jgi:hypothetical protein
VLQLCRRNIRQPQEKDRLFLNFVYASPPPGSIAEDRQHNHHQERDEDYDDGDLHGRQQEPDQRDQLFQQSDYDENQSNDSAEYAGKSKNAATHNEFDL